MSALVNKIPAISDIALEIMMRVINENEQTQLIDDEEAGPLQLASAMSDFFQMTSALENGEQVLEPEVASEIAHYGLDLVNRLSYQLRQLDIHDQRDNLARLFASLAVWLARRNATLVNLEGVADGFASLVNGENDPDKLIQLGAAMDEVVEAASHEIKNDEDRDNPWRPWRVLNLNLGIAATRSLDTEQMKTVFDKLEKRLPYDLPGFFADGRRQMDAQDVPQEVRDVMAHYAQKWPLLAAH